MPDIPINFIEGVSLLATSQTGVSRVLVNSSEERNSLSWDRYVRLNAAAEAILRLTTSGASILDVGGFDGALALFLAQYEVDLIDPATTGASLQQAPVLDQSYDVAVAVDVLEHIEPAQREQSLGELARIARRYVILNYPHHGTKAAQELVFAATNNPLIREHVEWQLPDTSWVSAVMSDLKFKGHAIAHSSVAVWLGQYLTLHLAPDTAQDLNRYLIEHHSSEPFKQPLYELVVFERIEPY